MIGGHVMDIRKDSKIGAALCNRNDVWREDDCISRDSNQTDVYKSLLRLQAKSERFSILFNGPVPPTNEAGYPVVPYARRSMGVIGVDRESKPGW